MIHQVDRALETLLRREVPLPEASIEVSFRVPEASWTSSASRPTVDIFLWDIARASGAATAGLDHRVSPDGLRQLRRVPSQVAFRYFVTVWAREERDEHELLGAILHCVLSTDTLALPSNGRAYEEHAPRVSLAGDQHRLPAQLWGGAPVKPGIYLDVALGIDAFGWRDRAAEVRQARVSVFDSTPAVPATSPPVEPPPLRRYRSGGALVMEGRPEPDGEASGDTASEEPEGERTT